jgi:hypothetical protein
MHRHIGPAKGKERAKRTPVGREQQKLSNFKLCSLNVNNRSLGSVKTGNQEKKFGLQKPRPFGAFYPGNFNSFIERLQQTGAIKGADLIVM